jgi:membrane associated rhomboid family serine protease
MFPIRDENPHFLTPLVTHGLIAANVLTWFLVQGFGQDPQLSNSVCTPAPPSRSVKAWRA